MKYIILWKQGNIDYKYFQRSSKNMIAETIKLLLIKMGLRSI